ncbi:Kae1-associated serine/threonine protein kinase [Microdochium nivale]|nr:Kae1-associated serine/threonine protein kinase [Microdochium nivale]
MTEKAIEVLHDAGIVWGDAKADNFLVDRHSKLWIIDFGGSHTKGWVDPVLDETEEGDHMGVDKVVNALRDPENMTFDPDADIVDVSGAENSGKDLQGNMRKRKAPEGIGKNRNGCRKKVKNCE